MLKKGKQGFTLAEVLITLAIIGIVAAMTIPTLIANAQKTQYLTGLKKAYAETTEALKLMANDYGCPDNLECTGLFGNSAISDTFANQFKKYFKLAKDCGSTYNANDDSTKCFADTYTSHIDGTFSGLNFPQDFIGYYTLTTADGFSMAISDDASDCNSDSFNAPAGTNMAHTCAQMLIDVNGKKGPNTLGRDLFYFLITTGKGPALYPRGGQEVVNQGEAWTDPSGNPVRCTEGANQAPVGFYCAGRVMEEGWQMNY